MSLFTPATNWQNLPLQINPIAFSLGSFGIFWYSLCYALALLVILALLFFRIKKDKNHWLFEKLPRAKAQDQLLDILLLLILAMFIGARLGYVFFYDFEYFAKNPWAIFLPFENGHWIGLSGLSFFGGLLGISLAGFLVKKTKKLSFLALADFILPAIPLGYFFGRIGNFLGGELFGRVSTSPLGMHFRADPLVLRHPSQLFEALGEGLILFLILWPNRNQKALRGKFLALYFILYGSIRFVFEFFRQPDIQLGLFFQYFSLGQIFCLMLVLVGLGLYVFRPLKI